MERPLLLAARGPRHPFRRSVVRTQVAALRRDEDSDLRLFALSFTAFFICFYTFLF